MCAGVAKVNVHDSGEAHLLDGCFGDNVGTQANSLFVCSVTFTVPIM